jgi:hypothetical protein
MRWLGRDAEYLSEQRLLAINSDGRSHHHVLAMEAEGELRHNVSMEGLSIRELAAVQMRS